MNDHTFQENNFSQSFKIYNYFLVKKSRVIQLFSNSNCSKHPFQPTFQKINMKNQHLQEQSKFRQLVSIIKNRNRFMSSDSDLFYQNSEIYGSRIIVQKHSQNYLQISHFRESAQNNQQNSSGKKSSKDQETDSRRSNQSTSSNARKRSHALRKQISNASLKKSRRIHRKSFIKRLNEFKQTQNTLFNTITWKDYQKNQWMEDNQVSQQQVQNHFDSIEFQPPLIDSFNLDEDFDPQLEPDPDLLYENGNQDANQMETVENTINETFIEEMVENQGQSQNEDYDLNEKIIEDKGRIIIPERKLSDFIPSIQMQNYFHDDFIPGRFPQSPNLPYQNRYELYYPNSRIDTRINYYKHIKTIKGLKIISFNCAFNIHGDNRIDKKKFLFTSRRQRMHQAVRVILKYMIDGYDFILLQQACDPEFQKLLVKQIDQFNDLKGDIYFYPQHLKKDTNHLRSTSILTKHQVKIGQLNFKIEQIPGYPSYKPRLPIQAFCEFRIKVQHQWENVCIFCAHFKSNRGHQASLSGQVRMRQIDAVEQFSKKYDRFYLIGDVNIPTSSPFDRQNNFAEQRFFDVIYYGISEIRGTFLYRTKGKYVKPQRNDRIWLDNKRENVLSTSVLMTYHDILLQACEDQDLDQIKLLQKGGDDFTYITVTDHTILDIEIMFLK